MSVELLRIDSRLVHGQVTTSWIKALKIDLLIVINDEVKQNSLKYQLMKNAIPYWLEFVVLSHQQMQQLINNPKFEALRIFVLVATTADACKFLQYYKLPSVNIGSLSFKLGSKLISDSVAVTATDIEAFKYIHHLGVALEIRKVYHDKPKNLWKLLVDKNFVKV